MNKIKLIFFDMEGTLFEQAVSTKKTKVAPSAWFAIAEALGEKAVIEEKKTQKKWENKQYSGYIEWMEDTIRIHKKYGLEKSTFTKIIDSISYTKNVAEVFKKINKRNIPTALISGGFKYQADKAVRSLKIKHSFVGCEYFWDRRGVLEHWNLLPADYIGKLDFMKLLVKEYGFSFDECAFVGDGKNDAYLAKKVGISIAFNSSSKRLQRQTTYSVNQEKGKEDFRAILPFLKI